MQLLGALGGRLSASRVLPQQLCHPLVGVLSRKRNREGMFGAPKAHEAVGGSRIGSQWHQLVPSALRCGSIWPPTRNSLATATGVRGGRGGTNPATKRRHWGLRPLMEKCLLLIKKCHQCCATCWGQTFLHRQIPCPGTEMVASSPESPLAPLPAGDRDVPFLGHTPLPKASFLWVWGQRPGKALGELGTGMQPGHNMMGLSDSGFQHLSCTSTQ